jgi:hypothetical protein
MPALEAFLARLEAKKKSKGDLLRMLDKTHPKLSFRKARIQAILREMKASSIVGAFGKARFANYTKSKTQVRYGK